MSATDDCLTRALDVQSVGKLLGHAAGIGHDPRECAYLTTPMIETTFFQAA